MCQASHARSRAGFTLIELLIVMTIIAVLAGLLLAGITMARNRAYDAQDVNDINQLKIQLENFKTEKGVYPPSRIVLYPTYSDYFMSPSICGDAALDSDSIKIINRIWKNIGQFGYINWASTANPVPPTFPKFVILEGDQCLVFFLGGVYDPNQSGAMGFAPSAKNPTADVQDPVTKVVLDRKKYFDFPAGRLNTSKNALFPSYIDNYAQMPFMYFAPGIPASSTPNQYNAKHAVTITYADATTDIVSPYYDGSKSGNNYWSPTTYQIITAGYDGKFGSLGDWQSGASPAPTTHWRDNRSNFSSFVLGVAAQ